MTNKQIVYHIVETMQRREEQITSAKVVQCKAKETFGIEVPEFIIKKVMRDTLRMSYRKVFNQPFQVNSERCIILR